MNKKIVAQLIAVSMSFAFIGAAHSQEALSPIPQTTDGWRGSISPYAWLPYVNTTAGAGAGSSNVDLSLNQVISNIKSGGMIAGQANYGKWGMSFDLANAVISKGGSFNSAAGYRVADKSTLQATMLNFMGSYTAVNNRDLYVDALAGVRWISLTTSFNFNLVVDPAIGAHPSSVASSTYGVVGINSRYRIMGSSWYIPVYADVGTAGGPNHMTWQGSLGIGKAVSKKVDVSLSYRALGFDIKSGSNDSTLIKGLFHGPQFMTTINF